MLMMHQTLQGNLVSSNRGTVHHTQHLNSLAGTWIKVKHLESGAMLPNLWSAAVPL